MPRILQSEIHSNFSLDTGVWNNYKTGIINLYNNIQNKEDFNDHLIREYNRKIDRLNQPTGLFIRSY